MIRHEGLQQYPSGPPGPPGAPALAVTLRRSGRARRISLRVSQLDGRVTLTLHDGDTVNIPGAPTIFVTGQVRSPGRVVWEEGMTVEQAIALSGGYTNRGSDRGIVRRRVDGELTTIDVTEADVVEPNDTVRVRPRRL